MSKCCSCNRFIYPWEKRSAISFFPIHLKCHQQLLAKAFAKYPQTKEMYQTEIAAFEQKTGIDSKLER